MPSKVEKQVNTKVKLPSVLEDATTRTFAQPINKQLTSKRKIDALFPENPTTIPVKKQKTSEIEQVLQKTDTIGEGEKSAWE